MGEDEKKELTQEEILESSKVKVDDEANLEKALKPLNEAEDNTTALIKEWSQARKDKEAEYANMARNNKKVQTWGGIAEAAAAITNLIGAAAGATPAEWKSPQEGWAARADALRKERDTKLEGYKSLITSLEKQKAEIQSRKATVTSQYNTQKQYNARQEANMNNRTMLTFAKIASSEKIVGMKNEEANKIKIMEIAARIVSSTAPNLTKMGEYVSPATYKKAWDTAVQWFKDANPGEFEDNGNPLP